MFSNGMPDQISVAVSRATRLGHVFGLPPLSKKRADLLPITKLTAEFRYQPQISSEAVSKRFRYDVNGGGWPEAIVIPRGCNTCDGISDVDFDHPAAT